MNDVTLSRLFVRFRDRRDGRALARLFDATAPELLRVAVHLVRDVNDAEDLLQNTFRVAIERAASFDEHRAGGSGVRGWLFGILAREAARTRRLATTRRMKSADAAPSEPEAPARSPLDEAIAAETPDVLARAVARLRPPYREVVERSVFAERTPAEIAGELDRAPGTVRVQLQRGLERLRAALPREFALGAALPPLALERHLGAGLETVRRSVLREAGVSATAASGVAGGKGYVLAGLAAGAALLGAAWIVGPGAADRGEPVAPELTLADAPRLVGVAAEPGPARPIESAGATVEPAGSLGSGRVARGPRAASESPPEEELGEPAEPEPPAPLPGVIHVELGPDVPVEPRGPWVVLRDLREVEPELRVELIGGRAAFVEVPPSTYRVTVPQSHPVALEPRTVFLRPRGVEEVVLAPGRGGFRGTLTGGPLVFEGFSGGGLGGFRMPKRLEFPTEAWMDSGGIQAKGEINAPGTLEPGEGDEGSYHIGGLARGNYVIELFVLGLSIPFPAELDRNEVVELDLEAFGGEVTGRLKALGGGEIRVRPIGLDATELWTRKAQVGLGDEFRLEGLPMRRHVLAWFPPGARVAAAQTTFAFEVDVRHRRSGRTVAHPFPHIAVDVEPREPVAVAGEVATLSLEPGDDELPGMPANYGAGEFNGLLELYPEASRGGFAFPAARIAVADGRFEGAVVPGAYVSVLRAGPTSVAFGQLTVTENGSSDLVVEFSPRLAQVQVDLEWRGPGEPHRTYWELSTPAGLSIPWWFFLEEDVESPLPRAPDDWFVLPQGDYTLTADFGFGRFWRELTVNEESGRIECHWPRAGEELVDDSTAAGPEGTGNGPVDEAELVRRMEALGYLEDD